ncbi:histidine phosphatase family protein [Rothia sp. HMSC067H10]|uniref:histidine phosphatase family protein n=1 Tax=Rothia sp. HMSC067H10 TaxID=1739260 RepID=UPI0009F5E3E8|nr:histidine phosphatase family protein [Rothia sp. HMSC067H10]
MFWDTALNRADDAILKTMTDAQTHHEHAETPGKIFLLRHGQTDWNINHRFQGRTDIPLNDTGREQIRGAVPQLREMAQRGVQIDGVVSSPLERAAESGRIVARELGVPYLGAYAGLEERSFGDLEGEAATPELVAASRTDGHKYGVEEREALVSRALTALNRVRREHEGKNIVVATHGMLIAVTMTVLLEGREHEGYETIDGMFPIPPNASLTELPTDFLDDAIDAHVLVNRQPKLHAEPFPKNLAGGSLTLIRHGQTEWNKNQLMQGISDIPLNETGRQQAHETGAKLQQMGLRYDRVLSSPLSRAHETAQRVGEFFGLTVSQTYPELVERAYGAAEGKNIPDYESDAPDRFYPGVETERDLYVRAVRALREVVRQYPGERLMVVSHGSLIRRAISAAQGYEHTQEVPNAQPLEVDIAGLFAFDENTVFDERGRLVW